MTAYPHTINSGALTTWLIKTQHQSTTQNALTQWFKSILSKGNLFIATSSASKRYSNTGKMPIYRPTFMAEKSGTLTVILLAVGYAMASHSSGTSTVNCTQSPNISQTKAQNISTKPAPED